MKTFVWLWMPLLSFAFLFPLISACGDDDDNDNDISPSGDDDNDNNDTSPLGDDDDNDDDDNNDDDDDDDDATPVATEGFVYVRPGVFTMGSPGDESGRLENETQHEVTLSHGFEIMATEVTQVRYLELMDYNPSYFPWFGEDLELPVDSVGWYDALAFTNRLSESLSLAPCYALTEIVCRDGEPGDDLVYCGDRGGILAAAVTVNATAVYDCEGFRLPTEAEWEYAARAGSAAAFPNGDIVQTSCTPVDPKLDAIGWYCGNSGNETHLPAGKEANAWGLYDMAGNVREWTWDRYVEDLSAQTADPVGPEEGRMRVVRGGAIRYDGAGRCRSAFRSAHTPGYRSWYLGIRPARTVPAVGDDVVQALDLRAPINQGQTLSSERDWPDELPFAFTRPAVGTPLTPAEVTEFTKKITGFWRDTNYFQWLASISHGVGPNDQDWPTYKCFFGDIAASKDGDVVTLTHTGFDDNYTIGMSKVFNNLAAAYLLSGDAARGELVREYCNGYRALYLGMIWDSEETDPVHTLQPRTVFTRNHIYYENGHEIHVDYDPVKHYSFDWNAHTIPNALNPFWGEIWIRNMRSKDDMPHIMRAVPLMQRVAAEAPDAEVRAAAAAALVYLEAFARDIVDSGYFIRTKDEDGNQYVPVDDHGMVVDLASFVQYEWIVPRAECNAKLTSALIGYGSDLDNDCANGFGGLYEQVATYTHYYNWAIIRYFHAAALLNALMQGENDVAYTLLEGMTIRADDMVHDEQGPLEHAEWISDTAVYLLAAAAAGLPLTDEEARLVMEQYSLSVDHHLAWGYWDPWDESVPNGAFPYRSGRWGGPVAAVHDDEMIFILEYCYSPFRNPSTAALVDCDVVADPSQWGQ